MKIISRLFVFSGISIAVTSFFIKGFNFNYSFYNFMFLTIILAIFHSLVAPVMKIFLIPFNLLTFGLFSVAIYMIFFNILLTAPGFVTFDKWLYSGFEFGRFSIPKMEVGKTQTLVISAFCYSFCMRVMHKLL